MAYLRIHPQGLWDIHWTPFYWLWLPLGINLPPHSVRLPGLAASSQGIYKSLQAKKVLEVGRCQHAGKILCSIGPRVQGMEREQHLQQKEPAHLISEGLDCEYFTAWLCMPHTCLLHSLLCLFDNSLKM